MLRRVALLALCGTACASGPQTYETVSFSYTSHHHLRAGETFTDVSIEPTQAIAAMRAMLEAERAVIIEDTTLGWRPYVTQEADACWAAAREVNEQYWAAYAANDYARGLSVDWESAYGKHGVTKECYWINTEERSDLDGGWIKAEFDAGSGGPTEGSEVGLVSRLMIWIWRAPGDEKTHLHLKAVPAVVRSDGGGLIEADQGNTVGHRWWRVTDGGFEAKLVRKWIQRIADVESRSQWAEWIPGMKKGEPPPPVVEAPPPAKIGRGPIVVVFDLEDPSSQLPAAERAQLSDYLAVRIAELGAYRVVPRNQLRAQLGEEKKDSYKACFDESCQIELGKALSAEKSLATKLLRVGDRCALSTLLLDLRTEVTERAASERTECGVNALMDAVDNLAGSLSR